MFLVEGDDSKINYRYIDIQHFVTVYEDLIINAPICLNFIKVQSHLQYVKSALFMALKQWLKL
jgi:hypothetical protein